MPLWRPQQLKLPIWVDSSGCGGDGLEEEVAMLVGDVETVSPEMPLANQRVSEFRSVTKSDGSGCGVVGVDVGVGC